VAGHVAQRLRTVVDELVLHAANTVEESRAWLQDAVSGGLDVLVVLGGDGAVHHAVQFCAETRVALGVVPCGSGNDLARALRLPTDPYEAVEVVVDALRNGSRSDLDLGTVQFPGGGDVGSDSRWFATVLCGGFDARVNERANNLRWPHGSRRYDVALLRELLALRPGRLLVDTGQDRVELQGTLVAVGNTCAYGGGIPVCPHADPRDGLLDVTVVHRVRRWELVRILPHLRTGGHIDHPAVSTLRARSVTLSGNEWPVYADGEPLGTMPLTVRCVPGVLTMLDRNIRTG